MTPALYLEDLSVGQRFASASLELDADSIREFAARYDPQPFHLDDEAARSTLFGGLAASGWHTASLTMRLLVDSDFKPVGGMVGAGIDELRWPRPTRPGDRLSVEIEVLEVTPSRSKPDRGMVRVQITTSNQARETVQSCIARIVIGRRPV
ncbi:MaoC family dehydratase [Malikia sp.]|uniref:MaoC family dehydratase n=1 Tax=Malikia sp. TaxID=2070706 RepID=UPI0026279247|nr:MaoC family dehydratase [Malikia sp.]MDD2730333.1 MaoC family dehydratase [Malikia sp.]